MTTINKLIDHLSKCVESDPRIGELPVFMAKDGEGNAFRPTYGDFDIVPGEEVERDDLERVAILWPAW